MQFGSVSSWFFGVSASPPARELRGDWLHAVMPLRSQKPSIALFLILEPREPVTYAVTQAIATRFQLAQGRLDAPFASGVLVAVGSSLHSSLRRTNGDDKLLSHKSLAVWVGLKRSPLPKLTPRTLCLQNPHPDTWGPQALAMIEFGPPASPPLCSPAGGVQ